MDRVLPFEVSPASARVALTSRHRPRNCVWELTLDCNLNCVHCGSSAGRARHAELSTEEALDVVRQLRDLGCELVTLSGGEPLLRPDWFEIARAIADSGMYVNMVTNGLLVDDEVAAKISRSGMCNVGVSIDGPRDVHDRIRAPGSFDKSMAGIRKLVKNGVSVGVMTTINRWNMARLEEIRSLAIDAGASMWRLQLAKPMGEICGDRDFIIAPRHLLDVIPRLAAMKKMGGIQLAVGDSIGYYGPHDATLRGRGWRGRDECWQGCRAGMDAIGIEADGGVKGCLSIQAKAPDGSDPYREGSVRTRSLADIWFSPDGFAYNRQFSRDQLKGVCRTCSRAARCRGGARCVSTAVSGTVGEDVYCWTRVSQMDSNRRFRDIAANAAAAAGLALIMGSAACNEEDGPGSQDVIVDATQLDAVECDLPSDVPGQDMAVQDSVIPDAGIQDSGDLGDAGQIDCENVCCMCDYGIIPEEVWNECCGTKPLEPMPDAAVNDLDFPDVPQGDAIDCESVCCECDYGIIPDEVWNECCAVNPPDSSPDAVDLDAIQSDASVDVLECADVCCNCEYGIIPDDVYQECCVNQCKDACCECDYGTPPPPQCCR